MDFITDHDLSGCGGSGIVCYGFYFFLGWRNPIKKLDKNPLTSAEGISFSSPADIRLLFKMRLNYT